MDRKIGVLKNKKQEFELPPETYSGFILLFASFY
jgi:hypothetical protein